MSTISRAFTELLSVRVRQPLNFLQVVVGPRQVGKTTGVTQVFDRWKGAKLMASADGPAPPSAEWITEQWNNARAMQGEVLLVLDEVQKIPRWSETVKLLFDRDRSSRRLRVVLLGSASIAIDSGLGESLAGRFELIRVRHWSFSECKTAFAWSLDQFVAFGGYPAPVEFLPDVERWRAFMHDSILEPVLSKDIFGLASIRRPALFRQVLELAMNFPSQVVSYQKFVGQLSDPGNLVTIRHYLEILQQAFFLSLIPQFTGPVVRQKASSPKILPTCPALVSAFLAPERVLADRSLRGRILESIVGNVLKESFPEVFYWRKRNEEVDFIVRSQSRVIAIEVKSGRERKRSGLHAFLREFNNAETRVIDQQNLESFLAAPSEFILGGT